MKTEPGIFRFPEIPLVFVGFFLNFFWEMVQSPLYDDIYHKTYLQILKSRLHCTLGDVIILTGAYWLISLFVFDRYWMTLFRPQLLLRFTLLGLGYTIFSEWVNIDIRSAWGYSAFMPRIPWLGTGLAPVIQWLILPSVTVGVARRFLPKLKNG
jgi:hypothetical protein